MGKLSSSRGDTLIEVMLAIAILSSVLAGSYSITRRALRISQASQDRIYGLKLLEGQIEMMRQYREIDSSGWAKGISDIVSSGGAYCFHPEDLLFDPETLQPSTADCSSFGPTEDISRYTIRNTTENLAGANIYVFRVQWPALNGGGEAVTIGPNTIYVDKVEYRYKLNQPVGL